jgi:dienelactone hydrolase
MTMFSRILVALAALVAGAVAAVAEGDVARSWEKELAYLPGSSKAIEIGKAAPGKQSGAVIFMHACNGIETDAQRWSAMLAKMDLVVVLPNSMARSDRKPSCDPDSRKGGLFPPVHGMRLDEIRYAADQVRKQPWFDGKNLFLMGYSEGAVAAVRTRVAGFRGVIATSWTCTNAKMAAFDGVYVPADTPLLTMMHTTDPWYKAGDTVGSCANKIAGRKNATHVTVPGEGHGTYDADVARKAVAKFIKANLAP